MTTLAPRKPAVTSDIYLTDLPSRVIGGLKPARGVGRGWVPVEYQADDISGTGLAAGYGSNAKPLTLELGLTGVHTLYIALGQHDGVRVWLDGESSFRELICEHGGRRFQEAKLHTADLTGKRLHIAPVPAIPLARQEAATFVPYIRAVPAKAAPVNARNLIGTNDGFSWIALNGMESVKDVSKVFTPFRDSDFFRILWCPFGADVSGNHTTRIGTTFAHPHGVTHAYRRCDRLYAQTVRRVLANGGDILKEASKSARDVGVDFWFYLRPEAFFCQFPHDGAFTSRFFNQNPQLRCVDELGRPVLRMSYAYPAVQDHMLAYIEELLTYQPGGLCLAFNRSLPVMIAEEPVVQAFTRKHGRKPKLPEEIDSAEMALVRYDLLRGFLERLSTLLEKKKAKLSCITHANPENARILGLDIQRACRQGLFESICVTSHCGHQPFWQNLRDETGVKIYPGVDGAHEPTCTRPDSWDHKWQAQGIKTVLESGMDGAFFWDADMMQGNPYNWHVYRKGGTPSWLNAILADQPDANVRFKLITQMRGVPYDRYSPSASY